MTAGHGRAKQRPLKRRPAGSPEKRGHTGPELQSTWLSALDDADDCIFLVNSEQRIVSWNRAGERLLGYSTPEALGTKCHELIAGRTTAGAWCRAGCPVWRSVKRGQHIHDFDLMILTHDGQPQWVSVGILVLRRRNDALTLHVLRDIGPSKRLERLVTHLLETLETHGVLRARSTPERSSSRAKTDSVASEEFATLTRRELEVLRLLSHGFSTRTIAHQLSLSPHTVRNHVKNALRKSGLHNRTQIVSFAIRNGLL
jgi:PAS domain S-box-containing protein